MTTMNPQERIAAAIPIATQLRDLVLREGDRGLGPALYDKLRVVLDILTTDDEPGEVLKYAALAFDKLYSGGRNIGDLIIDRRDPEQLKVENERLQQTLTDLGALLHAGRADSR